ncbi:putative protein kinase RLK-Pelle-CrRLK1L-1 family [Helianthus annuus]|uniref:non-specific serine/threonine protein kinase n=1 Tax=Helianthus annuus TaxID=4232 RepID=A0A251SFQ3_HELAN|nr:putative protein kinase RLK-Pelle-CrRLK1L-1 family [Helianthus annuus]KAJ0539043.1 putative protein kinase RLK-Pelle-CrRLK1L-1 family [Helianthus annuus]KAJ0719343.1 putative protein kinase RLK-Pelle-CrRLK1L-1 family [Helianthus annuus]KAJ0722573.1 putative protein kinase RLK-Pelle-CrRLK1L-1 family [Helianthus annuus]KAJ0764977.1 putative protein kinase RLK-Pelle-CrRLK1L-1 family [Helianthus annuus]
MSLVSERPCIEYSLVTIQSATDNFDESNLIGKGGFGKVYKGMLYTGWNTTTVAVKRLKPGSKQGVQQFHTEIKMLSMCRHSHLVTLLGYCKENEEMILVYEYMSCGNLADQLFNIPNSSLSWELRLNICIQAARALQYLHTGHSDTVIHLDVKCANILLDENMKAKISDLGLSTIIPANQREVLTTFVNGTRGYIDPHYRKSHKCSKETDVYAFGVVLLELLTGKHVTSGWVIPDPDVTDLATWIEQQISYGSLNQIIDRSIVHEIAPNCRNSFAKIISKSLQNDPSKRPLMSTVVAQLDGALAMQTGRNPSSSINEGVVYDHFNAVHTNTKSDEHFNPFSTHTNFDIDTLHEDVNIFGTISNSDDLNEYYNTFSTDTNPATSETRASFDKSERTSHSRTPTTESWMKSVQSRTSACEYMLPKIINKFDLFNV